MCIRDSQSASLHRMPRRRPSAFRAMPPRPACRATPDCRAARPMRRTRPRLHEQSFARSFCIHGRAMGSDQLRLERWHWVTWRRRPGERGPASRLPGCRRRNQVRPLEHIAGDELTEARTKKRFKRRLSCLLYTSRCV